jgi:DNA-binding transcriptional MerR regulator/methylmalonyl-CoA mutase cobalamin-binding subunit
MSGNGKDANGSGDGQLWPMGAVSRRTGIGEHTLRAWERRFGFPSPRRLESGHRRYTADQVQQLLLIKAALDCGYRAGDVVPLSKAELEELLRQCGAFNAGIPQGFTPGPVEDTLELCRRFDRGGLSGALTRNLSLLGVGRFLRERVEPLLTEVGNAWAEGRIEIRHEHFFSEVLEDVLRAARASLEPAASGRPVVLATLPDELHCLGLHIVALAVAAAGRTVRVLGPHLPAAEIAMAAEALDASAVGLSIGIFGADGATVEVVRELRGSLRPEVRLWLGGAGSLHLEGLPPGADVLATLDDLDAALLAL